ncbi:hypothetical protein J5N97_015669 [Dioscorea zingiberensis]|uniref:Acidic protein n=1 Tax=Dioscorea zingiberensis TaxID=325984 RepID=A0A9D5CIS9_9LILI|nr:hypothetical protein J5N97_015669 [Dioscorea zingiberensis]
MEGKGVRVLNIVVMVILILGLNLAQTHVEAATICCQNTTARNCYGMVRLSLELYATMCGCTIVDICPSDKPKQFCDLGCASSMCSTTSTLQNSDHVVEEAVVG